MTSLVTEGFTLPAPIALFLDFDGTLVGFKSDPETVHLTQAQTTLLMSLNQALGGALALISGRDLRDLSKRIPNTLWRLGNHGLYSAAPGQAPPDTLGTFPAELRESLAQELAKFDGVWIEDKGPVIALHHRALPEAGSDIYQIATSLSANHKTAISDFVVVRGHNIIEIKPSAANKGRALIQQMARPPFSNRTPIMIGDDTTDEDGFIAAQSLGGIGIKMGAGATQAKYRLSDRAALYALLGTLI